MTVIVDYDCWLTAFMLCFMDIQMYECCSKYARVELTYMYICMLFIVCKGRTIVHMYEL